MEEGYLQDPYNAHSATTSPNLSAKKWVQIKTDKSTQTASKRLEEFTRTNVLTRSVTPNNIPDDILPGIPGNKWTFLAPRSESSSPENSKQSDSSPQVRPYLSRTKSDIDDVFTKGSRTVTASARPRPSHDLAEDDARTRYRLKSRTRTPTNHHGFEPVEPSSEHNSDPVAVPFAIPYSRPSVSRTLSSNRKVKGSLRETSPRGQVDQSSGIARTPRPQLDSRRMLQLMYTTRGRMQGNLFIREEPMGPWSLSYCCINTDSGSLLCESSTKQKTVVRNLRGCKVKACSDSDFHTTVLNISVVGSTDDVQLRPKNQVYLDAWFAALLCWQSMRPTEPVITRRRKQQPAPIGRQLQDVVYRAPTFPGKIPSVIKVGKLAFLQSSEADCSYVTATSAGTSSRRPGELSRVKWIRVSCVLRESGTLKVNRSSDNSTIASIELSELPRGAVQRLDSSVFVREYCIAIYPQYAESVEACSRLRPIILSVESRILYEVWFVLLRAFTIPDLYGPQAPQSRESRPISEVLPGLSPGARSSLFRIEQSLHLRIADAKFRNASHTTTSDVRQTQTNWHAELSGLPGDYYAQILLDRQVKAKTSVKYATTKPAWYEVFEIFDLSTAVSSVSIRVKRKQANVHFGDVQLKNLTEKENPSSDGASQMQDGNSLNFGDITCGEVHIELSDLGTSKELDKWWLLLDEGGHTVGDVLIKIRIDQEVILMDSEYEQLSELLDKPHSTLTMQIADKIPAELSQLAEYLLNIYQVSGKAEDWLLTLAEEEIDGVMKESPVTRMRFTRRLNSNDSKDSLRSYGSGGNREELVRDLGRSATAEANLLFRGNTLLSKSLDIHMKRVGKEYLEDTLGQKLREIYAEDEDTEVDPNRIGNNLELSKNWRKLIKLTNEVWHLIYSSASKCPGRLRTVFRHIRACADDRYGDFLRTVMYSSVSGFLFLRFFCAAVLNPALFGLLKENNKPHAQRTFTLIAKSLQGLANMSTFGAKEPWMEPMNQFLSAHRNEFKNFIDSVCAVSAFQSPSVPPASYSTPMAMLTRLPPAAREGFPSLPYLIDPTRNYAALVNLWLNYYSGSNGNSGLVGQELSGDLLRFHQICLDLKQRTQDVFRGAEMAEKRDSEMSQQWVAIAEKMETAPEEFWQEVLITTDVELAHSMTGGGAYSPEGAISPRHAVVGSRRQLGTPFAERPKTITSRPAGAEELILDETHLDSDSADHSAEDEELAESPIAQSPKSSKSAPKAMDPRTKVQVDEKTRKGFFGRRRA